MKKNCGSSHANIFMDRFVTKYINMSLLKGLPLISLRFIDDIFYQDRERKTPHKTIEMN